MAKDPNSSWRGIQGLKHRSTGATSKRRAPIVRPSKPAPKPVGKEPVQEAVDATTRKEPPIVATTKKAPPVVATTSRNQKLLGTSVLQELSKAKDVANKEDDDEDNINVNDFLNTGASKYLYMPAMDEEPFRAHHDQPSDCPTTCQRLSFSQNTPPTVNEEADRKSVV